MGVSKSRGGPPKSFILIGSSIIFTIHLGVPVFWVQHPYILRIILGLGFLQPICTHVVPPQETDEGPIV